MKNQNILVTFLATITFVATITCVVGCDKEKTTGQQIDQIKADTKAAGQDMKDYTYAEKSEFVKAMQTSLNTLNADLDTLSAKIESSSDSVKAEAKPKLQALREQAAGLTKQLDNVKDSTESTWDNVKAGSKKAYGALVDGVQQTRQWISDKIKP